MEDRPRLSKHSYKFSIESRKSNPSSCRSLERPSWCERQKSLSKNHSLLDVMSLQSGRKSDLYDRMLDEYSQPLARQSLEANYNYSSNYFSTTLNGYNYQTEAPQTLTERKSEENSINIKHACGCYTECEWPNCECFESKNQICVRGFCCVGCIEMKQGLLNVRLPEAVPSETLFCTCKKTKCNKKYCSCFAAGVHCGEKCSCEGCINCPRKSEHMEVEEERPQLSQEELNKMEMPQSMDFEPPEFRFSNG